jgi:hypothetical protein
LNRRQVSDVHAICDRRLIVTLAYELPGEYP